MEDGFVRVRKGQESHDIVYASEFNADGSSLAVGDASGTLTVFNVFQAASVNSCVALTADSGEERFYDPETFDTGGGCIYAIHAEQDAVICGTDKGLLFTTWSDLNTGDPSITLQAIQSPFPDLPCEVNAIAGLPGGKHCFAAAGDGNAYAIDVETLTQTTAFTGGGSLAFLHCITMRGSDEENVFLTGAEDGCVRMYDARAGPDHQTKFKTGKKTTAPNWVSCIVTDDDGIMAMVGTGAKRLSTVHITSSSVASSTNLDSVPATLKRLGDRVFCGSVDVGNQDKDVGAVRMFDMQCKEEGSMQTANQGVYSIAMHSSNQTAAAGGYALSQCGHYSRPSGIDVYLSPPLHSFSMPMR